jgi:hypothetical protein
MNITKGRLLHIFQEKSFTENTLWCGCPAGYFGRPRDTAGRTETNEGIFHENQRA